MRTGKIHAAKLEASPRLQRVLAFLKARGSAGATTREIVVECDVCAVNSIIDELRENGVLIACRAAGRTQDGANVYRYSLEPARPVQGQLFAM